MSLIAKKAATVLFALATASVATSCGADGADRAATSNVPCPASPINVVVTIDQWADMTRAIGAKCAEVEVIVATASSDPHEFEPTPNDTAQFANARVVVMNGVGYDEWASKTLEANSAKPNVVNAGQLVNAQTGSDPHLWYDPAKVQQVATAIAKTLREANSAAGTYFDERLAEWSADLEPYTQAIEDMKPKAQGKSFAATEPVFNAMANAVGLRNATPTGYETAATNETDPAPGDIAEFETILRSKAVDVLIFNKQSTNPTAQRLRDVATENDIAVVEVTETQPNQAKSFMSWQMDQLQSLAEALDK